MVRPERPKECALQMCSTSTAVYSFSCEKERNIDYHDAVDIRVSLSIDSLSHIFLSFIDS